MNESKCVILEKKNFTKFIKLLLNKYNVFGPSKKDGGENLIKIESDDELMSNYKNFEMSPKVFFFPQNETLFSFDTFTNQTIEGYQNIKEPEYPERENILLGIRPCDTMAISFLDRLFSDSPCDPYYLKRREKTIIISFTCDKPSTSCFCNSVNCAPDSEVGTDLLFSEFDDRYFIKIITRRGEELLNALEVDLPSVTNKDLNERNSFIEKSRCKLRKIFDIVLLEKKLDDFEAPYWQKLYRKCIGCGICTYFCPTCHCFNITDETGRFYNQRIRTWDSCMFKLFTLHTSGHNPRPTQKERVRQRVMHKFKYTVKNFGKIFCVGCGRCIIYCPVNLDIRDMIKKIVEVK